MSFYLNLPLAAHRNCKYVMRDETVCGAAFVAMSAQQEVCSIHSDAQRMKTTKEKKQAMKNQMPGKPEAPDSANALTNKILIEVPRHFPDGCILWRCNVGGAYPLRTIQVAMGMMMQRRWEEALRFLQTTRVVTYGRAGLPDIDGMVTIHGLGVRVGIEVKAGKDKQNQDQFTAERVYAKHGCIYIVARSVEQATDGLKRQVELLKQQVELGKK